MRRARAWRWVGLVITATLAGVLGAGLMADRLWPPPLDRLGQASGQIADRNGDLLHVFLSPDQNWRLPIAIEAVDPTYLEFLRSYEDQRFDRHPGVDPLAMARAGMQTIRHGRIISGASTLTMQVARLLEPGPRGWRAKLAQIARALQIERRLTKAEILEAYLSLAPFGGNLEGVRAASLAYFGKEPARLTEAEAALLVALPRSPEATRSDRNPAAARAARDKVLRLMRARGLIDDETLTAALEEEVPARRQPFPNLAPHLALRLKAGAPGERQWASVVDAELQAAVGRVATRHLADLEAQATIAVMVVANKTREVHAYLGSADYFSLARSGANDMVRAIRSPGSALKPFIYALAFEDLAIHPETLMPDVAMRFGDYAPRNFDDFFRGEIVAREALQASLNLPAVALLDRIGPRRFARRLEDAGVALDLPAGASPGLPMALGGVGISLEQLVTLYAALADGGRARRLNFAALAGEENGEEELQPLVSPLAAYYVTRILLDTPPPPNRLAPGNRGNSSGIAYKTGTSYGFRDAWAIGYTRDYTIGVWVGRPDGTYSAGRMGRDAAAPILFEIFDLLPPSPAALPDAPPPGVINAGNGELPRNLKRFAAPRQGQAPEVRAGPRIVFPVDGAEIDLPAEGPDLPELVLEASGGELPLRWLVNGKPVAAMPYRRQTEWAPDGLGGARVTVIDSAGRSASSEIWLR